MKIFIDANAFVSNTVPSDSLHQQAQRISSQLDQKTHEFFTSSDVLKESLTIISQRGGKQAALDFLVRMSNDQSQITVIFVDEQLHNQGLRWFQKIKQKDVSAVDCTSFAAMKAFNIETAFSFDQHFKATGFNLITDKKTDMYD